MIHNLHIYIEDQVVSTVANSIIHYMDELIDSGTRITNTDTKTIVTRIKTTRTETILRELSQRFSGAKCRVDFTSDSAKNLNLMFTKFANFVPSFNAEQLNTLCAIFGSLNYHFKSCKFEGAAHAFDPIIMLKLLDSDKISTSDKSTFIQKTLKNDFEIGFVNFLMLEDKMFESYTREEKHRIILTMVDENLKDPTSPGWAVRNLPYFESIIKNEQFRELGERIVLNTLKTHTGNKFKGFLYGNSPMQNPANLIPHITEIRHYMCGDYTKYKNAVQVAESLDMLEDKTYWLGVMTNSVSDEIKLPVDIEFDA